MLFCLFKRVSFPLSSEYSFLREGLSIATERYSLVYYIVTGVQLSMYFRYFPAGNFAFSAFREPQINTNPGHAEFIRTAGANWYFI